MKSIVPAPDLFLLWVELYASPPPQKKKNDMLKIMSPVHQNVTLFGKRVIDDVISEDEVMLEWDGPLIQYDR